MSPGFFSRHRRQAQRAVRIATRRDVEYRVGDSLLVLPPEHLLPAYQADYPLYDKYFLSFLSNLSSQTSRLCIYDIGANVGDTAAAALSAAPNAQVVCVEGSEYFLKYLRNNVGHFETVRILEGFVTHRPGAWTLSSDGSTGRLVEEAREGDSSKGGARYFKASEILERGDRGALGIWKSDTDGFDIPILLGSFAEITQACEVLWIEFDPLINVSGPGDVEALLERIGDLPRDVIVFDNFGHRLFRLPSKEAVRVVVHLAQWLDIQAKEGTPRINYFDIWVLSPELADLMTDADLGGGIQESPDR